MCDGIIIVFATAALAGCSLLGALVLDFVRSCVRMHAEAAAAQAATDCNALGMERHFPIAVARSTALALLPEASPAGDPSDGLLLLLFAAVLVIVIMRWRKSCRAARLSALGSILDVHLVDAVMAKALEKTKCDLDIKCSEVQSLRMELAHANESMRLFGLYNSCAVS